MRKSINLFCLLFFSAMFFAVKAEVLYVFFPTVIRSGAMQKKLQDAGPGISITVFGRYKDFESMCQSNPPDAILATTEMLKQISGFSVKMEGLNNDKPDEQYVLLSVDQPINPKELSSATISVIEIGGKRMMEELFSKFFKLIPQIKRVTKVEDLLPTLTLNMAQGILIPELYAQHFRKISNLNLITNQLPPMRTTIVALAVRANSAAPMTIKTIKSLKKETNAIFRVTSWK